MGLILLKTILDMKPIGFKLLVSFFCALKISIFSVNAQDLNNETLEIRFQPDSILYVYENIGPEMPKQIYTAVLQNMAFVSKFKQPIILNQVKIEAIKDNNLTLTQYVTHHEIKESAVKFSMYQKQGVLDLYDFQFQTSRYLKDTNLASSDTLKSGEGLIIMHETFLFDHVPDALRVSITGRTLNGKQVSSSKLMKVGNYKSKNSYILPLKGSWLTAAGPSLIGHHRWGSIQEFAFDFIKLGKGQLSYKNNGENLNDYYAYAQSVYTIGDGIVVSVLDGIIESSDNLKKLSETETEYMKRIRPYQEELMRKGFQYVSGNHVIVRHANNEYSSYFHLKNGSVTVKEGAVVKQGQLIGQIGHSGNSTEPHLHFHVSNGEDMAYSRSLPVEFENIILFPADNGKTRHLHSGQFIKTKK